MKPKPPPGYRTLHVTDKAWDLNAAGQLYDLCRCGHTREAHRLLKNKEPCYKCNCEHFNWAAYIVKDTEHPSNVE